MELIKKYYPNLSESQYNLFERAAKLYQYWNERINVISRKDIENLYERHILYSLAIERVLRFKESTKILDVGTGGGFPGIPLAILMPDVQFHLIDSTRKKITVVQTIIDELQLQNVTCQQIRSNELKRQFDFVVSRAVTSFPVFIPLVSHCISLDDKNGLPNGILYLKGGDMKEEMKPFGKRLEQNEISSYFEEPFFETKKVLYYPIVKQHKKKKKR